MRVLCALALAVSGCCRAGDPVEEMRAEIRDLKARLAALEAKLAEADASKLQLQPRPAPAPPGPAAEAPRTGPSVKLGGYGSLRFETSHAGSPAGFTFRRFVLTTDAKITDRLRVYSETEFERLFNIEVEKAAAPSAGGVALSQAVEGNNGGEIAIEQAWGQYNFAAYHGLRAGVVLVPLGRFNLLHDDDYWDLPRRTLVDRDAPVIPVKAAWRDLGAGVAGGFSLGGTRRLDYQAYALNGAALDFNVETVAQTRFPSRSKLALEGEFGLTSGFFDGSKTARALAWRAAFSPSLAGEFALSGYHGRYTPDYLGVAAPLNSLAFDYKWRRGPFELEGEAVYTSLGRMRQAVDAFARTYFRSAAETSAAEAGALESEVEFELGGLSRTRYGFWNDFKYNWRPAWLKRTFLGRPFEDPRLIPILRYERVWLNRSLQELEFSGGAVTGLQTGDFEQDRVSLGLSYRPVRSFGLQFAWEHNRRLGGEALLFPRVAARSTDGFLSGMVFAF